jgi:hypothetical protein
MVHVYGFAAGGGEDFLRPSVIFWQERKIEVV